MASVTNGTVYACVTKKVCETIEALDMIKCCICGKQIPTVGINKVMLSGNKYACFECIRKAGHNPLTWMHNLSTTEDMLKKEITEYQNRDQIKRVSTLKINKTYSDKKESKENLIYKPTYTFYKTFSIDTINHKWQAENNHFKRMMIKYPIHGYADLLSYEYQEDGGTIISGGVSEAIIGGALFGTEGMLLGALLGKKNKHEYVQTMQIKLYVSNKNNPVEYIDLNPLNTKIKRTSSQYRKNIETADKIVYYLNEILRSNKLAFSEKNN